MSSVLDSEASLMEHVEVDQGQHLFGDAGRDGSDSLAGGDGEPPFLNAQKLKEKSRTTPANVSVQFHDCTDKNDSTDVEQRVEPLLDAEMKQYVQQQANQNNDEFMANARAPLLSNTTSLAFDSQIMQDEGRALKKDEGHEMHHSDPLQLGIDKEEELKESPIASRQRAPSATEHVTKRRSSQE